MISTLTLFTTELIALSANAVSDAIDLSNLPADAKLFIDVTLTGDGTATGEYQVGNSATDTHIEPSGATDIFTGHTKTSGTGGRNRYQIENPPIIGSSMKIKITETGGANSITVTVTLTIWAVSTT